MKVLSLLVEFCAQLISSPSCTSSICATISSVKWSHITFYVNIYVDTVQMTQNWFCVTLNCHSSWSICFTVLTDSVCYVTCSCTMSSHHINDLTVCEVYISVFVDTDVVHTATLLICYDAACIYPFVVFLHFTAFTFAVVLHYEMHENAWLLNDKLLQLGVAKFKRVKYFCNKFVVAHTVLCAWLALVMSVVSIQYSSSTLQFRGRLQL